jgi:DNA mismatch repair protein MLH3
MPVHGGRGTFLASLSAMSLLSITSHHHLHRSHNTLSMHKSEVVSRQVPAPAQQHLTRFDHGTRTIVRNLFGNMPVRVKQRAIESEKQGTNHREWQDLKGSLVSLLLAWPKAIALTLRQLPSSQSMVIRGCSVLEQSNDVSRARRVLSQSSFITADERNSWIPVSASIAGLKLSGAISLDPSPTKHVQFISFDIHPLLAVEGKSMLHDEINRLFISSAFGNEEEAEELTEEELRRRANDARYKGDGYTNKELKGAKKSVDRWPMFYINIQRPTTAIKSIDLDDILDDKQNSLTSIVDLLQAMVFEFLARHHFRPKAPRSRTLTNESFAGDTAASEGKSPQRRERKTVKFAKSPSGREGSSRDVVSKKSNTVMIRSTDSDLLGANIKLPAFRRSLSTSESPFDGWSRMKSGAPNIGLKEVEVVPVQEILRPATAPPLSSPVTLPATSPRPSTPLISSSGKVIRRPFDDMPALSDRPRSRLSQPVLEPTREETSASSKSSLAPIDLTQDDSHVVAWINPITKVKSLIDKRTGHTLPTFNTAASRLSTRSLLSSSPSPASQTSVDRNQPLRSEPSPWLSCILQKWDNPIFRSTEPSIPQVSLDGETEHVLHGHRHNCSQIDIDHAFSEASSGIAGRISKIALQRAEVIGQVDRKFILVNVPTSQNGTEAKMLVIIDQHAADERIRIENLLAELCTKPPAGMPNESRVVTTYLQKSIVFELVSKDIELLAAQKSRFADWGILYDLPPPRRNMTRTEPKTKHKLTIHALPPGIAERCKADPRLLIDLIRTEIYSSHRPSSLNTPSEKTESKPWLSRIHSCPPTLLNMLNSRACRSAIMFNDVLSKEQCEVMVGRLAETAFPFQCAHGRPSLLPLVEVGRVLGEGGCAQMGFGGSFRAWKDEIGK